MQLEDIQKIRHINLDLIINVTFGHPSVQILLFTFKHIKIIFCQKKNLLGTLHTHSKRVTYNIICTATMPTQTFKILLLE